MAILLALEASAIAAPPDGWWVTPVERAALRLSLVHEHDRGYSTAARPRDVAGQLALSCEYQEGRPCGDGEGLDAEVDAAAGYGPWLAAGGRLRLRTGHGAYDSGVAVDRLYLTAALGPFTAELGRDAIAVGPAARTQLGWGRNAPPLDHVRLATARPLALSPWLGVEAAYVLGRLADPQTYPDDLVSIARLQLDVAGRVQLGAMQLLQLGGRGAPGFGPVDFVLEHVRRRDATASTSDSSNRRMGVDVAVSLGDTQVVYQLVFEDLRKELVSALRHDADHLVSVRLPWLTLELRKTGERSHEHAPRITGFTQGGHIVGDPLGPAALAAFAGGRIPLATTDLMPWAELARLGTDTFSYGDGPVARTASGPTELRARLGIRARIPLTDQLELEPEAIFEDVERPAFVPGTRAANVVLRATLVWRPAAEGQNTQHVVPVAQRSGPTLAPSRLPSLIGSLH